MPPATMDAFRDHGEATPDAIEQDIDGAKASLADSSALGVSLDAVTAQLVEDGVTLVRRRVRQAARRRGAAPPRAGRRRDGPFAGVARRAGQGVSGRSWKPGARAERSAVVGGRQEFVDRARTRTIGSAGCASSSGTGDSDRLEDFAEDVKARGFADVVLLGMGGSSLGPEVLAEDFRPAAGLAALAHARQHRSRADRALEEKWTWRRPCSSSPPSPAARSNRIFSWRIFSTASARCWARTRRAKNFVAVTDPGSSLEREAKNAASCTCFRRALDRRALFRAVGFRSGAGRRDGS